MVESRFFICPATTGVTSILLTGINRGVRVPITILLPDQFLSLHMLPAWLSE